MESGQSSPDGPALALIDAAGHLARSTDAFRSWYEASGGLNGELGKVEQILRGELDRASVTFGELAVELEAVTDHAGARQVALTVSSGAPAAFADPVALLRAQLDASPAIGWLKGLDGRNLHINPRYTDHLGTGEERIRGRRDDELAPRETVDGPRLRDGGSPAEEPLQLEYTVGPFEGRPALAVLRFALQDRDGRAVAVCGVAAPLSEPGLARSEGERLMHIERWNRLGPAAARAELFAEWGVAATERTAAVFAAAPAPAAAAPPSDTGAPAPAAQAVQEPNGSHLPPGESRGPPDHPNGEPSAPAVVARHHADDDADALEATRRELTHTKQLLEATRGQLGQTRQALRSARQQMTQADDALAAARQATGRVSAELRAADLDSDERRWSAHAQRTLAAALAGAFEWSVGLKYVVRLLGVEGKWDAVCAWRPDERRPILGCAAMWTAEPGLAALESATWQQPLPIAGTALGRAMFATEPTNLGGIEATDDDRLITAARHGMRSALLVPLRDGRAAVGVLELLSRAEGPVGADVEAAIEAVALQLGQFWHLLRQGAEQRWRTERL